MTQARRIARFALELSPDDIPARVWEDAKLRVLDTLGCGLAASGLGIGTEGRAVMRELGGRDQATVIGAERGMPAPSAAFANAMLCHSLDFDDTHSDSISHVSVVTCPTSLAVGEARGSSGRDVLTAIVAGNEIVTRLGMARPGAFHERGFHATSVVGIFGAAVAATRLDGLKQTCATSALGIVGSMASGILAFLQDGTATKPIHPAWAAHGATIASTLAATGAAGPQSVFEGSLGFFHAFLGSEEAAADVDRQLADLGSRWETPRIAFKPYPACHLMHGSLGATAQLISEHGLRADDVKSVVVRTPAEYVPLVLEPAASKLEPRSDYEAKFSLQYSTAAMLVTGRLNLATYEPENLTDPLILALTRKITYETPAYPTYPSAFPGGVRISTNDGRTIEADHPHQLGGPDNPMSAEEIRAKFRDNAALALDRATVEDLERGILNIEEQTVLRTTLGPLSEAI